MRKFYLGYSFSKGTHRITNVWFLTFRQEDELQIGKKISAVSEDPTISLNLFLHTPTLQAGY